MKNFNRDRGRQGGGFNRAFGGNKSFSNSKRFGDRNGAKTMHKAICSECGEPCEVPFKPTGDRPIYCSNCFGKQDGGNTRPNKFGGDRNDKKMFDAICDKCGKECQIPFRPTAGKPIYCNNCFGKGGNVNNARQDSGEVMQEIKRLNAKMDELIKILAPKNLVTKPEASKVVKEAKTKKPAKAKAAPKKVATKKKK